MVDDLSPVDRRSFLIGAGAVLTAGLVRRFEQHLETHSHPLLLPPSHADETLWVSLEDELRITLGPPAETLPAISWREYLRRYENLVPVKLSDFRQLYEEHGVGPRQLDEAVPWDTWAETWGRAESPQAKAIFMLRDLDLGPRLGPGAGGRLGGIEFYDAPVIGSSYLAAHCQDLLSVSLLQARLVELDLNIAVNLF